MKRLIVGLVLGIALGAASVAAAASTYYWSERGQGYSCQGVTSGVTCKSGGFQIGVTKTFVYIQKGSGDYAPTYGCTKWRSWAECFEG